jgi:hypothetical protein
VILMARDVPSSLLQWLKFSALALAIVASLGLVIFIIVGLYKTFQVEHAANQKLFLSGRLPNPSPDGFYKGNAFTGRGKDWQGKLFDRVHQTGINRFSDGQRFVFKTYQARGLRDGNLTVLRIDYNQPGNPWWLHFIVDEVVETSPGHYLGKVHLKVIPDLPFTLTYFELSQP